MAYRVLQNARPAVSQEARRCANLGLWFDQYLLWEEGAGAGMVKKDAVAQIPGNSAETKELLNAWYSRHNAFLVDLPHRGYAVRWGIGTAVEPLIVGMGNPSPLENGLTFQIPMGFPLVPATSQKGVTRAYARVFEGKKKNSDEVLCRLMGDDGQHTGKGQVTFFDAFPLADCGQFLCVEIMTPHQREYHEQKGQQPPADYYSPTPIPFLAVGRGVCFFFSMAARQAHETDLDLAWCWLKNALETTGVGAKTRVGYGAVDLQGDEHE